MILRIINRIKAFLGLLQRLVELSHKERKTRPAIPVTKKVWLWKKGFLSISSVIYSLDHDNVSDYLSDYDRFVKTPKINADFSSILHNKIIFIRMFKRYQSHLPPIFYILKRGLVIPVHNELTGVSIDNVLEKCFVKGHELI